MGALKGNITVRRYRVKGDTPTTDRILAGARAHAQIPIDPMTDIEKAIGWANLEDPSDVDLSVSKISRGDTVLLGLRVDTLKPPTPVVKRLMASRLQELGRKATKQEKQSIKDDVVRQLRGRYYPTIRSIDVIWQIAERRVLFWSHAKGANEWLVGLFQKSFGLELEPLGPCVVAGHLPEDLMPTPEMVMGFPGLPGRPVAGEDSDEETIDG